MPRLRAFSLLEVMVAIALLAVGMTVLLQVQTRSINLAQQAREMTVATMLARSKLLDCQADLAKKGFSIGDYDEEGNFGDDGYPDFFWECHAYKPDIPVADTADVQQAFSATGNEETGQAAEQQGADLGMQFLAPVMSQLSSVLGDSIRELVVIVRWGKSGETDELRVATHLIDKTAVNQVAAMIQQASSRMPGAPPPPPPRGPPGGKG
ncbi:MAG: hypothetical protein A2138_25190 [Deltaproteobacteria bacterium RBG_16_71_12]|nr:MAG: hypothetical protein A2138_25190 [Deltaproteobacteria bacterium RBG_16_71_12]